MQTPKIWGILMAMAAVIAAYWMGHSAGFQAGQGEGFDEGKREGAKEGSMRGYAVGFDRGRRGQSDDGGSDETGSRLRFGIVGLVLAAIATFTLASNSRRTEMGVRTKSQAAQTLSPDASTILPIHESNRPLPSLHLDRAEPAEPPQTPQAPNGARRLVPVKEDSPRKGLSDHRTMLPVPTTGPLLSAPENSEDGQNRDQHEFDLPPIQQGKPTW